MVVARPGGFDVAGSFGGFSAHRLFIVPSETWGDPAAELSARLLELTGIPSSPKGAFATRTRIDNVGHLAATTSTGQLHSRLLERCAASGGEMLFKIAFVLLGAWLLGVLGAYPSGDLVHVLLLVGLMLLLLAFVRARDAALRRAVGGHPDKP